MRNDKLGIGIIGFGRMGHFYYEEISKLSEYEILWICDVNPEMKSHVESIAPEVKFTTNEDDIFNDDRIDVVALTALVVSRYGQIQKAVRKHKHIISEKPIGVNPEQEKELVALIEGSDIYATVNLYLRYSWYHNLLKKCIDEGELGDIAIIRVCHMTPGLVPGEGHVDEGPSFRDCGMHYVDIARWYAGSEYSNWHAQALKMWNYKDPWWLQVHGTFENDIIFDITQGFVYGHFAKEQTHNSYIDIVGTHGVARMTHDFKTAVIDIHGINLTWREELPFGNKNIGRMAHLFANTIMYHRLQEYTVPLVRDAYMASVYANAFIEDSRRNYSPIKGTPEQLEEIRKMRSIAKDGYGLLNSWKTKYLK